MTPTPELHAEHVTSPGAISAPVPADGAFGVAAPSWVRALLVDRHRCFAALIIAATVTLLLTDLALAMAQDTWLALVDGRQIVQHGIPRHVVLTLLGHGDAWIDQQWLAQVWMYGLHQLGGLGLLGVVDVAMIGCGLAGGVAASIRLGAGARSVLPVLPASALVFVFTNEVRTQPFAYPLFVLTAYLLAADSRQPGRRVYWCLPVLVLWANVHGSASLGAGLVALRGITIVWSASRRGGGVAAVPWARALGLIVGGPLSLLVTPYGTGIISYYRATLLSTAFRRFVTEWQPVTTSRSLAVLCFGLAGVSLWAVGRYAARATPWERAATVVLAAGAIIALRNVVWFALAVLIILPVWIDEAVRARERPAPERPRLNGTLLAAAGAVVAIVALRTVAATAGTLTPRYPQQALAAVQVALDSRPDARVFADERYADWLLWEIPSLRGRVTYDAAFELLSRQQLATLADFKSVSGLDWLRAARGDRVLVLGGADDPDPVHAVRVQTGARLLYDHGGVAVLAR